MSSLKAKIAGNWVKIASLSPAGPTGPFGPQGPPGPTGYPLIARKPVTSALWAQFATFDTGGVKGGFAMSYNATAQTILLEIWRLFDAHRGVRKLPPVSTDYQVTAGLLMTHMPIVEPRLGGIGVQGTNNKFLLFILETGNSVLTMHIRRNVASGGQEGFAWTLGKQLVQPAGLIFIRLRKVGANITFGYSFDGLRFTDVLTEPLATYLGGGISYLTFGGVTVDTGTSVMRVTCFHWDERAL
jgi:hypothetical protein